MASLGKLLLAIALLLTFIGGAVIGYTKFATIDPRPAIGNKRFVIGQDGYPISFFHQGQKESPIIVLLASLGRSVSDFNELAAGLLATGFQTVAIEAPGIGDSGGDFWRSTIDIQHLAQDVHNVVSSVTAKDERVFLVGHGFGSQLAHAYAGKFPDKTKGLVLLAPGGESPQTNVMRKTLRRIFLAFLPEGYRREAIQRAYFAEGNEIPAHWMGGWHVKTALLQTNALRLAPNKGPWHAASHAPTLLVHPDGDKLASLSQTLSLKKSMGETARLVTQGRAGHALLPERPDDVLRQILDFLRSPTSSESEGR